MGSEEYRQWLDSLKVGDKVAVKESKYTSERVVFTEIVTITPKRAMRVKLNMLDSSDLFKDGVWNSGSKWMSTTMTLMPITPELIMQEERKTKAAKLKEFQRWDKLDGETVDRVYELIFKTKDETIKGGKKP